MTNSYPQIVQDIHKEFFTASDRLLTEANLILATSNLDKVTSLKSLGFINVKEVTRSIEQERSHNQLKSSMEMVLKYKSKYINYKFITENQLNEICTKYKLVCAPIENFTGFVPSKNLIELQKFSSAIDDIDIEHKLIIKSIGISRYYISKKLQKSIYDYIVANDFTFNFNDIGLKLNSIISKDDMILAIKNIATLATGLVPNNYFITATKIEYQIDDKSLVICAPEKDFKFKKSNKIGNFISELYKPTYAETFDDPVVCRRVKGGYIIGTAWGDEASDPIVLNPQFN